jgi:hypothetical protein
MDARLASAVVVSGLIRTCEAAGGYGTVLYKGDAHAGAILIMLAERGTTRAVLERVVQPDGRYAWRESAAAQNDEEVAKFLARKRRIDPDLWIVELDVASAERFAAELIALD